MGESFRKALQIDKVLQKYSERSLDILLNSKPLKYTVKFCETEQRKTEKL